MRQKTNSIQKGSLRWLWLSLLVFLVDLGTKHYFFSHMIVGESQRLLPFLNLTLVLNDGAAFSFLGQATGWQQWLFGVIALVVCLFILLWLGRIERQRNWAGAGLALVFGGAMGNFYDRVVHGYVVDFIDLHAGGWHWPVFNVADSAIVVGVIILLVEAVILERKGKHFGGDQ